MRAVGDRSGEATTLNNIGVDLSVTGRDAEGAGEVQRGSADQCGRWATAVGRPTRSATSAWSIESLGEMQKALEKFNEALPIRRAVGDRRVEATTLNNIGAVYRSLGETRKALEKYNEALPIRRAVGDRSGEAATLNNIGMVYQSLGETQKALEKFNEALPHQAGGR